MKINILGNEYEILFQTEKENEKLEGNSGLCEAYAKKIIISKEAIGDKMAYDNIELFLQKVLRHEIVHAYLFECGQSDYFEDERLVETLAQLIPKISKVFDSINLEEFNNNLK